MSFYRREILVVDDEPVVLETIRLVLSEGYNVHCFTSPKEAELYLKKHSVDLAVLDLNLSECSGLKVLEGWKTEFPELEVIFCSGETKVEKAIECLRQGASDYVVKPFKKEDLLLIVGRTLEKSELKRKVETLKPMVNPLPINLVGHSPPMLEVLNKVRRLKHQTHMNVLILGESGTGKELVARLLHQQEEDSDRPLVIVNMPAMPTSLIEAELFGVTKGAYTDAKASRAGKFELAENGDVFLDEVGDIPVETQAKLLRTLQEKHIERIGSTQSRPVRFRVISATNQPLGELVKKGRFREDFLFRLSDVVLRMPSLSERIEDIPLLVAHFIQKYRTQKPFPMLTSKAMGKLRAYEWPGNIRQLESTIKRTLVFHEGDIIDDIEILDPSFLNPCQSRSNENAEGHYEAQLRDFEKNLILSTLRKYGGDRHGASRELGLSRATFYRKLNRLNPLLP